MNGDSEMNYSCRACGSTDLAEVIDLGEQPLANNLLREEHLSEPEPRFPLIVDVCCDCWLMQLRELVPPTDLFSEYIYFSSFSDTMLQHARAAVERYRSEFGLNETSFVVEIASNDGYLLKNFVAAGVPCLGFEPAANVARVAEKEGVESRVEFFGSETASNLAKERRKADLILGNNVFAHAPDVNDFVGGLKALLSEEGSIVLEFPYGVEMVENCEFDTIYHEHVYYFTLRPLVELFSRHGLDCYDVEQLPIHGGSLRIFVAHSGTKPVRNSVGDLLDEESRKGFATVERYGAFRESAERVREELSSFLREKHEEGRSLAGYGASAKGSTLLNFLGGAESALEFIVDRSHYKQGKLSPGCHIPILSPEALVERKPDYAVLLVWNFAEEVIRQQADYLSRGGKFVIPLPSLRVVDSVEQVS